MPNPNKPFEPSTVFNKYLHIWAISKQTRGPGYTLDDDTYEELVQATKFAARLVDDAIAFVERAGAGGLSSKKLLKNDGQLSDLGLIADHFNLIRALEYRGDEILFAKGAWSMAAGFKLPTSDKLDSNVQTLYTTVLRCLQLTVQGLRGGLKFRGLDSKELALGTAGMVTARQVRMKDGQQVSDKFHPDEPFRKKGAVSGKVIPALADDKIFLGEDAALLGAIKLNYERIGTWRGPVTDLRNRDTTLSWTIVHEATHKFARTRDVNDAYRIGECRQLYWHSALRNATHYERLAGIDFSKTMGKSAFYVAELIRTPE